MEQSATDGPSKRQLKRLKKNEKKKAPKEEPKTPAKQSKREKSTTEGFTILGDENTGKRAKVSRVLPLWLSQPTVIDSNLQELSVKVSSVKELDKELRKALKQNGVKYLFPIQAEVVPWVLRAQRNVDIMFPRDLCVSAPTGSGKTLAFVLPIIQALKRYSIRRIRAMVILPTQDLAEQVYKTFRTYTQTYSLEVGLITGKYPFEIEQKQIISTNETFGNIPKIDILVCTAGRLVNHLKSTKGFDLNHLEFLVIDEADRVLESVQNDWLYHLDRHITNDQNKKVLNLKTLQGKRPPQKLLFSATLSQDPEKLEKLQLFQPKLFASVSTSDNEVVGKFTTPQELTEKYIECTKAVKPLVLYEYIKREDLTRTLVFVHSIEAAHRLKILLQSLFKMKRRIEEISSSLKAQSRDSLIGEFSAGKIDILICTDSLARGIDLPAVKCVISYSVPKYIKTYIHRVGRTARAGELGLAVTILSTEQVAPFKSLLGEIKKQEIEKIEINEEDLGTLEKLYEKSLKQLKGVVQKEEKSELKNIIQKKKAMKFTKRKN